MLSKTDIRRLNVLKTELEACNNKVEEEIVRNRFEAEELIRRAYLGRVRSEIRTMISCLQDSTVKGAGCPDGTIKIDLDASLGELGFDIFEAKKEDVEEIDFYPEEIRTADGWIGSPRSRKVYQRHDPDGFDDVDAEDAGEPADVIDWEVGGSYFDTETSTHPGDLAIDTSALYCEGDHNPRLGRPRGQCMEPVVAFYTPVRLWQHDLAN